MFMCVMSCVKKIALTLKNKYNTKGPPEIAFRCIWPIVMVTESEKAAKALQGHKVLHIKARKVENTFMRGKN